MRNRLTADQMTAISDEHSATMLGYARQWLSAGAEDVVQSAFLALVRQNADHGVPDNPVAWLYQAIRNAAVSQWRSESRRKNREEEVARSKVSYVATGPSILEAQEVADSFERLAADLRETVYLRIWGGLSFEEIAKTTGKSRSSVFRLYREGLETMKKELTK